MVRPVNVARCKLFLQNNGKNDIYIKKINPGQTAVNPTPTNYDYKLGGATGEGHDGDILEIKSISKFIAVTDKQSSELAIMETVYI
jgi:hypothetical protein